MKDDGKMDEFVESIRNSGQKADVFFADATSEEDVSRVIDKIEMDIGPIECAVYGKGS